MLAHHQSVSYSVVPAHHLQELEEAREAGYLSSILYVKKYMQRCLIYVLKTPHLMMEEEQE